MQEPVFQISVTGFSLNLVQLNMFSWCEWDMGYSCNWRKKLYIQMLSFLCVHTPTTDGILEILGSGVGGAKTLEIFLNVYLYTAHITYCLKAV